MSSLGMLAIVGIAAFILTCLFRLGPAYLDDRFVSGALKSMGTSEPDLAALSNGEIRSKLVKAFNLNNIRGEVTKHIEIKRGDGKVLVNINYEKRIHMFMNIDVVLTFANQLDSSRPGECCKPSASE